MKKHYCTDVDKSFVGKTIELFGWVQIVRSHGGVIFVDLRDRSGIVQLVFNEQHSKEVYEKAKDLRSEWVIRIEGEVRRRENPNPQITTGEFEVFVSDIDILNEAETSPIGVVKQSDASEELRLRYRYLDMRRSEMRDNIIMRHKIASAVRHYLNENGYIDIETPFLTKSTPEGARDFLVPSRLSKGKFYALPQSPQIFKQLLMISGFEKYYQIVRCFRDEDLRADRQPEFTQIDIEASFIEQEGIYALIDGMFESILKRCYSKKLDIPIKRFTYDEAMQLYGTDRPDLRYAVQIKDLEEFSKAKPKEFIVKGLKNNKRLYGIEVPLSEKVTRKVLDFYSMLAKQEKVDIFTWLKSDRGTSSGPLLKLFEEDMQKYIDRVTDYESSLFLMAMGEKRCVLSFLGKLRTNVAEITETASKDRFEFCWITDFPLFEWSDPEERYVSVHHPFTSPKDEDAGRIKNDPLSVKSKSYDLVLNGIELGGGSIRIHDTEIQREIFSILGLSESERNQKFGFLLDALKYGAPPHGGIAFGLDRIVMMLQGEDSIRDVIPFPKTTSGLCPLTGAPDNISKDQLTGLGLSVDKIQE
ncbi:MAG: aspartate--tRNA ligase [Spirochaetota bacterium]|nr:MAG: aspartate--tRNA ligase [Spirochaetota bacterium]